MIVCFYYEKYHGLIFRLRFISDLMFETQLLFILISNIFSSNIIITDEYETEIVLCKLDIFYLRQ